MYSYLSESEKYRVTAVNEDGKNTLFIKNLVNNSDVFFPAIPDGDIKGVRISKSEKKIRLTVGTSKSPNNIYVYDMGSKKLKKLTETLNPEIVEDAIAWYESKGITCRNDGDDCVELLARDKAGVAMAWVQVTRKELEYRADMLEEEHR